VTVQISNILLILYL